MPHTGLIARSGDEPVICHSFRNMGSGICWTFTDKTTQYLDDLKQHLSYDR